MLKYFWLLLIMLLLPSAFVWAEEDDLLDSAMDRSDFLLFKERVGLAVANHPEFKASEASLRAAYAQVKGSRSSLLPQISVILDSNNALSRKYADDPKEKIINLGK